MDRPVITIGESDYRITRTPKGESCCVLCDIFNYCLDNAGMPCLDFSGEKDWHFKRIADGEKTKPSFTDIMKP